MFFLSLFDFLSFNDFCIWQKWKLISAQMQPLTHKFSDFVFLIACQRIGLYPVEKVMISKCKEISSCYSFRDVQILSVMWYQVVNAKQIGQAEVRQREICILLLFCCSHNFSTWTIWCPHVMGQEWCTYYSDWWFLWCRRFYGRIEQPNSVV